MPRLVAIVTLVALAAAPSVAAEPAHTGWPNSIDSLGDSGSTGYNSGPVGRDVPANSWSTGSNPAVRSHSSRILEANPNARILVVGISAFTVEALAVIGSNTEARAAYTDGGPCDPLFDENGKPDPQRVLTVNAKIQSYNEQLAAGCSAFIHCRYDHASIDKLPVELTDFSRDWGHQSVQGLAKQAETTWGATFDFTDGAAPVSKAARSGRSVTLTATDAAGVAGIEYRLAATGVWTRYVRPVLVPKAKTLTWRAVDLNGNIESSKALRF